MAARRSQNEELLLRFLDICDGVLERYLSEIYRRSEEHRNHLSVIWNDARQSLFHVMDVVKMGLSGYRRRMLDQVGMFGDVLREKLALLEFDVRQGAIKRVLKRLNSMLSSIAKVFPVLHCVKELKEHAEVTMEGLANPPEFITLTNV